VIYAFCVLVGNCSNLYQLIFSLILSVVLYGCETLRVFENRVLRRIFGPKGDEVTGGWRKLHNEELHNLYSSPSIIRMIKSERIRACSTNRGEEDAYMTLVGRSEKRESLSLGRPRHRSEDNIKMDLREIRYWWESQNERDH
jgi:hypothetical protein